MLRHGATGLHYFAGRRTVVLARDSACLMRLDVLVCELSERCVAPTRRRLRADSDRLGASELRGYVRAKAASTIRSLVRDLIKEGCLQPMFADEVAARALERTVHRIVRDTMNRRIVSAPMPVIARRAA